MPEWLVEEGIGEERALLYDADTVKAARVRWPGALEAGQIEDAILVNRAKGSRRGTARFASGEEAVVDRLPPDAAEGRAIRLQITRAAIDEHVRRKPAQSRPTEAKVRPAPSLAESLGGARVVRSFPRHDWEELWSEAWTGAVEFAGGVLWIAPTAAMTLIDIDGRLPPRELAQAAITPLAQAIRRFDLGGSIGIDFPGIEARADRKAVDEALAAALVGWDHERTAMNGFGFVQIVARLERPSLLHRLTFDRVGAAARLLLRRAEGLDEAGAIALAAHPSIIAALHPDWLAELARRTGRDIRPAPDPALALEGSHAQIVPR